MKNIFLTLANYMYGMLNFDYFIAGSWDHQFLLECVLRTLQVFTLYNFKVQVFVCDGASANLALIKLLCGYKWEQLPLCDGEDPFAVTASFQNPCEDQPRDKRVFVVVCPSHQVI